MSIVRVGINVESESGHSLVNVTMAEETDNDAPLIVEAAVQRAIERAHTATSAVLESNQ